MSSLYFSSIIVRFLDTFLISRSAYFHVIIMLVLAMQPRIVDRTLYQSTGGDLSQILGVPVQATSFPPSIKPKKLLKIIATTGEIFSLKFTK